MRERNKSWKEFSHWCEAKRLGVLPAHAWTVAAYVRFNENRKEHGELLEAMKEIARRHLLKGFADPVIHPVVVKTLERIENRQRNRHHHSDLFDEGPPSVAPPPEESPVPEKKSDKPAARRKTMSNAPKLVRRKC
ncbi:MAG: hypothetical protein ACTSV1_04875 [Alphaproteobacteria bacterium]